MITGMRSPATLILIALMGACSAQSISPVPLSVVGLWNQGANLRDIVNKQTHIHTGYFSFAQRRDGFAGSGQQSGFCRKGDVDYAGPLATGTRYEIAAGLQEGDRISFKTELCTYEGTVSPDDAHIAGTARCTYTKGGISFAWEGDWLANRER